MGIDRAGWPFILGALVVALALSAGGSGRLWALPFLVLAGFFVFFFRDPDRDGSGGDPTWSFHRPTAAS